MPLTDAAPLLAAQALGLFARHGLRVSLSRAGAWAALRDRLAFGALDGAHLLYPMPIAAALGLGQPARDWVVSCGLGRNGSSIALSASIAAALAPVAPPLEASRFAAFARRRAAGGRPLRLAVVHVHSTHNYLLRHWLAAGGLDVEAEVRILVVPPPLMVEELQAGRIDGCCVGEPWGSHAVLSDAAVIALGSGDVWPGHGEKVLGFAGPFAARERPAMVAATAAIIEAARWLEQPANHLAAATLLAEEAFPGVEPSTIGHAFAGHLPTPGGGVLPLAHRLGFRAATWLDPAEPRAWLGHMRRWDHLPEGASESVALAPFVNTLWAEAARSVAEPAPQPAILPEGPTP